MVAVLEKARERGITKLASDDITKRVNLLIRFATSVLEHPAHAAHLMQLMQKLGLNKEEVIRAYVDYDLDIYSFGNEIFSSLENRFVLHMHNLLEGSWHQERQAAIINFLQLAKSKNLVDVGFGVPTRYIKELVLTEHKIQVTLCDMFDMAFHFCEALLELWEPLWRESIRFKQTDMINVELVVDNFDTYLFQDSIEHVPNPTQCFCSYVNLTPKDTKFILSIPVGPIIPAHYMAWETEQEVEAWLQSCGVQIEARTNIRPNPLVDIFADPLGPNYHNVVVLCSK